MLKFLYQLAQNGAQSFAGACSFFLKGTERPAEAPVIFLEKKQHATKT